MDVGAWLRSIGLAQYEQLFRQNDIDAAVLGDLTDADLEKLGLTLGHRKRLLKAIASLDGTEPVARPTSPAPPSLSTDAAERRPIIVMFCDLVGSTSLAARLDAEDWRNLVGAYLDEASAAVTGLGGHVLKKLGDGLMALFGYPRAQENDAERAVRAALAIQRALGDFNARNAKTGAPELAARIGLDMGPVVVDAAGEVFGDAPNVAARVQSAAEPGTVLVSAAVQRQVSGLFVVEDKGAHPLKGVPSPVTLYRVVRASGGGRRGGARALTPLVGREDELALLTRRWSRALDGEGQYVQIVGEPGIGKSRLVEEFRAKLAETPHTWVEWAASQLLQNTPLHPLPEWGRLRFGGADATDEGRLADLESTLRLIGLDAAEYAPLVAPLVDIPLPEDRWAQFPPEELRRRQLAAMTAWVLAGARTQPVVLAFEDLHWADPTSLDLLRVLAERGAQSPLLIIATTRPEFRAPWAMRSHHGVVSLAPLDRAQVRRMVGEIASRYALSEEMIDGVGERTGGVPLFVEEVTRLLLERDAQGGAQAIPPTLQQSLAARLDRLGEAREVAQIGAVLGRNFSYRLLSDVSSSTAGFDELRLHAALDRLTEADLLFVDGAPPTAAYRFKHALIQDAAYESLLKSRRQGLHRRAAEALRDANVEPEAIAHHFTEAGLDDLAMEWWGKAGDQALRRSAFQEAIAHLGKAIAMAETRAGAPEKEKAGGKLKLQVSYGNALMWVHGQGAPEALAAFERARDTAGAVENAPERLVVTYGLFAGSFLRGELGPMREHATAFLGGVAAQPDSPEAGVAHRVNGLTAWFAGDFVDARTHLEQALAIFNPNRDRDLAFSFGHDPGVAAMAYLSLTLWPLGAVGRARQLVADMMRRTMELTHVGTICFANMHAGCLEMMRGDPIQTNPFANALARLARDHDLKMWTAFGVFLEGWTAWQAGARDAGLAGMRDGVSQLAEQGAVAFDGLIKTKLARAEADDGAIVAALAIIDEAIAVSERTGHSWYDAELRRTRGEILFKQTSENPAPAEDAFLTAIAIAQAQEARSFELRAALSLAKLYQSTARPVDAHGVLAPALKGFSPTPEMPEIAEAQALLAMLSEADEVRNAAALRKRQIDLQLSYGNALIATRGHGAVETTAAFARARELASGVDDITDRLSIYFGLWLGSFVRGGELVAMREAASDALALADRFPVTGEAAVAHRMQGLTYWFQGDFANARIHLERALAIFDPDRDRDLAFRFGQDIGVSFMNYLALALWPMGEIERARELENAAVARARETDHVATLAYAAGYRAIFEMMRRDAQATEPYAREAFSLGRTHGLPMYLGYGGAPAGWAQARLGDLSGGVAQMREGLDTLRTHGFTVVTPMFYPYLAELEAELSDSNAALGTLDRALAEIERTEHRTFDAEVHRVRGEILLRSAPADTTPAEQAFKVAIGIAREQGARSFGLRAALSLAKLYQSTAHPADAHGVLATALEGFSPTPEMPEIAEAQELLAALSQTDEARNAAALRKRQIDLQLSYGNALIAARGHGSAETTAAFARARALATGIENPSERLSIYYGLWVGSFVRGGELAALREASFAVLELANRYPGTGEAAVALRMHGMTHWYQGDFANARIHLERALAAFDPERDGDLAFRFGQDNGVSIMNNLALALWPIGEIGRARELQDAAVARAREIGHVATTAYAATYRSIFEMMRHDARAAEPFAAQTLELGQQHGLSLYVGYGAVLGGWVRAQLGDRSEGVDQMRDGLDSLRQQGFSLTTPLYYAHLAVLEAELGESDAALGTLDRALAEIERTEHRTFDAEVHRIRGDILLKRNPANPSPAEAAFLAATAIAQAQRARSFELRAALSLAKLYQTTGRAVEAHVVLAPALEGFSPTPEMPEIAEAQALLAG